MEQLPSPGSLSIHSIREAQAAALRLRANTTALASLVIRIPADPGILQEYALRLAQGRMNGEAIESIHYGDLMRKREKWDQDMTGAGVAHLLTSAHGLEHLEFIFPRWHLPIPVVHPTALLHTHNLSSLSLQWRFDSPMDKLASVTDTCVYDDFIDNIYGCLTAISETLTSLRLSIPYIPYGLSSKLLSRVLCDVAILPNIRTLDLTHMPLFADAVTDILSTHPDIHYLILDQGSTWIDRGGQPGFSLEGEEDEYDMEESGPYTMATILDILGRSWVRLGALIALDTRVQLHALSFANRETPFGISFRDLTAQDVRERFVRSAHAVADCEDAPQDVRDNAAARLDALALCDVWPAAYTEEEVRTRSKLDWGVNWASRHVPGCPHLEGFALGRRPTPGVWPDAILDELSPKFQAF